MKSVKNKFARLKQKKPTVTEEDESSDGYENSEGEYVEKPKFYRFGGYHPVKVGDEYNGYVVQSKLGFGHFSTVWLVQRKESGKVGALKVVKSAKTYTEMAIDEIKLMQKITDSDKELRQPLLHILDNFSINGPNGTHICLVMDVGGSNLLDLIKYYKYHGIPLPSAKYISKQVLQALDFIHTRCGIIHTDLKPENVLLSFTVPKNSEDPLPEHFTTKLADFGNANWVTKRFTDDIQTLEYRAPEVILGLHWGCPVDVWSHGCMIFELVTGDYLFKPKGSESFSIEEDHLAQFMELLGFFQNRYLKYAPNAPKYFKSNLELKHIPNASLKMWKTKDVLIDKYKINESDADVLADLLEKMLIYDEFKRATAKECLQHEWFSDVTMSM
ncbi:dual specificity protein kinase lkH1, putative [Entamoeba invadens IP1]|uniref:non-specific serine/threonine protein kinase n=1 Tax=Entamoeba invadens IP1 TaxID=370355 RepID=A0A0A1U4N3_ENTIV|nr:dual specificity protein kinase lkH1, putative [Entamoeba invadens IP1]ELP89159.1 dual specificity protein kinase lkH1, putative [Entamoeba invadens IP1]|eukprot:XP_004255930.1 dual specificity protein kinase lkH1, putative [Entamoeba invadens IP1]